MKKGWLVLKLFGKVIENFQPGIIIGFGEQLTLLLIYWFQKKPK